MTKIDMAELTLSHYSMAMELSYLSNRRWERSHGFIDLNTVLNGSIPLSQRPLLLPQQPSLLSIMERLSDRNGAEHWIGSTMVRVFSALAGRPGSLFVDTGSNEGTWSVIAASYGMRVLAVDPQQLCLDLLGVALAENNLSSHVEMHLNLLMPEEGRLASIPTDQCHGTALFSMHHGSGKVQISDATLPGRNKLKSVERQKAAKVAVASTRVDRLVAGQEVVEMWHLDVEGAELMVLNSAQALFQLGRIRRVMLEFIPFRWVTHGYTGVEGTQRGLSEAHELLRGWDCRVVCPKHPKHHGVSFNFSLPLMHAHIMVQGRTICEDLYCVAPGVESLGVWV